MWLHFTRTGRETETQAGLVLSSSAGRSWLAAAAATAACCLLLAAGCCEASLLPREMPHRLIVLGIPPFWDNPARPA
ncbi:hypothetical protein BO70DRAFT_360765 [Aspergillus heteromorphus CBS 117.55]|uniref:Uncharacterized protein n=1 Tax=Aspergillus heteromorphus CBS 117.55 TaxID=1448321 RepID=A0A317WLI7_9EURO|nr:uncharacterized protein BO70DRAFT_360765 [Aspergillus heteromorphus CBS 117.55]PWY85917.1 hypothetical protein BO70DRAFT_360765 [Aspergillus heteromorphus CBS 117.55]